MSILSKFTDWLIGQSRRARRKGQSLLDGLIGRGVPKAEAAHRVKLEVEGSASNYRRIPPGRLEAVGFSRNSKRYAPVGKSGRLLVKRSISEKEWRNRREIEITGSPLRGGSEGPTRLAAGERPYKSAATEAAIEKRQAWRKRVSRGGDFKEIIATHTFIDREGRERRERFSGHSLAVMQEYRKDWNAAFRSNDDTLLERYARLRIVTHGGLRIYPATKLRVIRSALENMMPRRRNRFDADVFYANGEMDLAA